jgi:hypothetical protein
VLSLAPFGEKRVRNAVLNRVRFSISDIFLLEPEQALTSLSFGSEVEGTIVGLSDSGTDPRAFALVEVVTKATVVVPTASLQSVPTGPEPQDPAD